MNTTGPRLARPRSCCANQSLNAQLSTLDPPKNLSSSPKPVVFERIPMFSQQETCRLRNSPTISVWLSALCTQLLLPWLPWNCGTLQTRQLKREFKVFCHMQSQEAARFTEPRTTGCAKSPELWNVESSSANMLQHSKIPPPPLVIANWSLVIGHSLSPLSLQTLNSQLSTLHLLLTFASPVDDNDYAAQAVNDWQPRAPSAVFQKKAH